MTNVITRPCRCARDPVVVRYRDRPPAAEAVGAQPKDAPEQALGLDAPVITAAADRH